MMPTLFAGFRLTLLVFGLSVWTGCATLCVEDRDSGKAGQQECQVEDQMGLPGHVVQDAAAGTRDFTPEMEQAKCNIYGKYDQHPGRKKQARQPRAAKKHQGYGQ